MSQGRTHCHIGKTGAMIAMEKEGMQLTVPTYHSAMIGVGTEHYGYTCSLRLINCRRRVRH